MASKAETTKYVQTFLADMNGMGTPRCFRTDNGGEFTGRIYTDFCDSAGIRRECTAPGKPQQNAVVESAIWRAMMGGHAVRRKLRRLFPDIDLAKIPNVDAEGNHLWLGVFSGLVTALTAPLPRQTLGGGRSTRCSSCDRRSCRWYRFFSLAGCAWCVALNLMCNRYRATT